MKLGYCVQGSADEAFVKGFAKRYCVSPSFEEPYFRGESGLTLRREIKKALQELIHKACHYVVILTDSDTSDWKEVYKREWKKVPDQYQHLTVFGVADRNIECWLALDRHALAKELGCDVSDIPSDNPSEFVKRSFGITGRQREDGLRRIEEFVQRVKLNDWIKSSNSFEAFYERIRELSKQATSSCHIPNEREAGSR